MYILLLTFLFCIWTQHFFAQPPFLEPYCNTLEQVVEQKIHRPDKDKKLKLHLGCGENYFNGYINIDFPHSEHTVQRVVVADCCADITQLRFPHNTVDEIRLHHVFEHFDRATALALLTAWHHWLKPGGLLLIETPDFKNSIPLLFNPELSYQQKEVVVRHLYGSHEAEWAFHRDGWYDEKYQVILRQLGFDIITIQHTGVLLRNVIIIAQKKPSFSVSDNVYVAKQILTTSMVDQSEEPLWKTWCNQFDKALSKMILHHEL